MVQRTSEELDNAKYECELSKEETGVINETMTGLQLQLQVRQATVGPKDLAVSRTSLYFDVNSFIWCRNSGTLWSSSAPRWTPWSRREAT